MMLLDHLPESVTIDNAEYPVNADFRNMMAFETAVQRCGSNSKQAVLEGLCAFYPKGIPGNVEEAIQQMLWFYSCGKETENKEDHKPQNARKSVYSFDDDGGRIHAAFLSQYGMDLLKTDFLHWWEFRQLFEGLDDNCEFVKIMGYRSMKITSKMPAEQRRFYQNMKRIYKLKDHRTEEQKEQDMIAALSAFF